MGVWQNNYDEFRRIRIKKIKKYKNGKKFRIKIIHYKPWLIQDQNTSLCDFFDMVAKKYWSRMFRLVRKYGRRAFNESKHYTALSYKIPFLDILLDLLSDIINGIIECMGDVNQMRNRIHKKLNKARRHLLVFIDDLDRLDKDEVHSVFRLIRQVADFPNTTYVIAMDPIIVAKSLSGFFGNSFEDGKRFIDKIVQNAIQIPNIDERNFFTVIDKQLKDIWTKYDCGKGEDYKSVCDGLCELFTNKRQLIRFSSQIQFVLPTLRGEVNATDLFMLEAIRTVDVQAYKKIYESKNPLLLYEGLLSITEPDDMVRKAKVDDNYEKALDYIVSEIDEPNKTKVRKAVEDLFSGANSGFSYLNHSIDNRLFFDSYFIQDVSKNIISNKEFKVFSEFVDADKEKETVGWLNDKYDNYDDSEFCRILELKLKGANNSDALAIRIIKALSLCKCCNSNDYSLINRGEHDVAVLVDFIIGQYCMANKSDVVDAVKTIFNNNDIGLYYCLCLNYHIKERLSDENKPEYVRPLVDRFKQIDNSEKIKFPSEALQSMFNSWKKIDADELIKFMGNMAKEAAPADLAKLVNKLVVDVGDSEMLTNAHHFASFYGETFKKIVIKIKDANLDIRDYQGLEYLIRIYEEDKT